MNQGFFGFPPNPQSVLFNPDLPPSNPHSMDDEFTGYSLDPKWIIWNAMAGVTNSVANSHLTINVAYTVKSATLYAAMQPISGSYWKVRAKFAFDCATWNYFMMGLIARRQAGTDQSMVCGAMFHSTYGAITIYGRRYSGTTPGTEYDLYNFESMTFYLELENDGTNLTWRFSATGAFYTRCFQTAIATWPGSVPDSVGIFIFPYNNANTDANWGGAASIDWFRRVA